MKVRWFTTFGDKRPRRVFNVENVTFVGNEIHYLHDGWNSPLAYYQPKREVWIHINPDIPHAEMIQIEESK